MDTSFKDNSARVAAADGITKTALKNKNNKSSATHPVSKEVTNLCEKIKLLEGKIKLKDDAAESDEGREAFSAAALKYKIPETEVLGEVAAYCNERRLASRQAEESGEKLYLWALLKKKMVIVSEARVMGLGPRFMSVYINKLGIERRVYYADIEGLIVEWLESTCTLVLDLFGTKPFRRRGYPSKFRPIEEAALVKNPAEETPAEEDTETSEAREATTSMETLEVEEKSEASPVFFPLVLKNLSAVPVALHAIGGDNGPLDIGVRLYMCSYFK